MPADEPPENRSKSIHECRTGLPSKKDTDYIRSIQGLCSDAIFHGTRWLDAVVCYCRRASATLPELNLFQKWKNRQWSPLMTKLFGTDGIQGKASRYPMDADTAMAVGRAVARLFHSELCRIPDRQRSADLLGYAGKRACRRNHSMGADALLTGMLPIAYTTRAAGADAGISFRPLTTRIG